ncbi:hypothetical protein [uncultured Rhodoblastus sp.]|uniref:hypothetical protein n=1 Tax=uncultured Rhodoblastus sp. TaxID=543037 RepID=UPI0025D46933|nr:hypothetical protein [uncultured Rhodoblastus sp.]
MTKRKKAHREIENVNMKVAFPFKFLAAIGEETTVVSFRSQLTEWLAPFAPDYGEAGVREIGVLAEKFYGVKLPARPAVDPENLKKWKKDRAAIIAAFDQAKKEYDDKYKESGLDVLQKRVDRAWCIFDKAEEAILKTKPTTPAGGAALVHFCAEYLAKYNAPEKVSAALVNALAALASGAEVTISAKLASAYAKTRPADEAATDQPKELLEAYHTWLFFEYYAMSDELSPEGRDRPGDSVRVNNPGHHFHWVSYGEKPKPLPSTRAAAVMAAVGCDWQEGPTT